jgi:murein DD-endopeptidase MepM/ murein hydrolase activator NlpD
MRPKARTARAARRPTTSGLVIGVALGFLAGMVVMAAVVTIVPAGAPIVATTPAKAVAAVAAPEDNVEVEVKPSLKETPPAVTPSPTDASSRGSLPAISADPVEDLRQRNLTLPVHGIKKDDLHDAFNEMRDSGRRHEGIDVLAPRHTPVLAVEDGTVARLFLSDAGGITIYHFDPTEHYAYYYAHLENYAPGLKEGDCVTRGEVIGYVGTTGNAPRDTPHLHFAIFKMTDEKKWWQGTPIDPYSVLR